MANTAFALKEQGNAYGYDSMASLDDSSNIFKELSRMVILRVLRYSILERI